MLRNRLYYVLKPWLPISVRLGVRRWLALRKREQVRGTWPILPGSEKPPAGWSGWPDNKRFALVLTHDIESQVGLDRCEQLMELETQLGFRSAFNLIPENGYAATPKLRQDLTESGFEVGVHDLYHDGKLFLTKKEFSRNAIKINLYLKEWSAKGFRSAFMLQNLDWMHELDIDYDTSTFDIDPFEPQPYGQGTIFPFWVPRADSLTASLEIPGASRNGYVELPYTLPQDSTLFLLLQERQSDIWFQKLDWIAERGGMALVNVHPDYMAFNGASPTAREYPAKHYQDLLMYVRSRYNGAYWNALPREVAALVRAGRRQIRTV